MRQKEEIQIDKQTERQTDLNQFKACLERWKDGNERAWLFPLLDGEDERERKKERSRKREKKEREQTETQTDIKDLQNLLKKMERWR